MPRFGKLALGVLTILAVAGVTLCVGETRKPAAWPSEYGPDTQVKLSSDGKTITVENAVAIVSRRASIKQPFQWVIGSLPDGYTLEIDFRVQDTRKGPFGPPGADAVVPGRYVGTANRTLAAGTLAETGPREVWKYDVVLRDRESRHKTAIDPAIIIME
jgi:hypothetical protein